MGQAHEARKAVLVKFLRSEADVGTNVSKVLRHRKACVGMDDRMTFNQAKEVELSGISSFIGHYGAWHRQPMMMNQYRKTYKHHNVHEREAQVWMACEGRTGDKRKQGFDQKQYKHLRYNR